MNSSPMSSASTFADDIPGNLDSNFMSFLLLGLLGTDTVA